MIVSDLEGTLTKGYSYWMNLNLELGLSEEEDRALYEDFMNHGDYTKWMEKIVCRWKEINKNSLEKLNKAYFDKFNRNHLKIKEEAREFIHYCRSHYIFYVISGAPWEFCALAKEELGFDDFFSTNKLIFDKINHLERIEAHKDGFHKEKIMFQIAELYGFQIERIIAIGDSENDFTLLNAAGMGILVGKNVLFPHYKKVLNPSILRMECLDFKELKRKIDKYTSSIHT